MTIAERGSFERILAIVHQKLREALAPEFIHGWPPFLHDFGREIAAMSTTGSANSRRSVAGRIWSARPSAPTHGMCAATSAATGLVRAAEDRADEESGVSLRQR